jgi:protein-tyrosine phosphatase
MMEKRLPLEGLLNTRELGGYPVTVQGKRRLVKQGLIYRSGSPENLTPAGKKKLEEFAIKTVVDFRSPDEKHSVFNLASLVNKVDLPIDAGNLMGALLETGNWPYNSKAEGAEAEMHRLYIALPVEAIPHYRKLFSLLLDTANLPLLFHCSAGKDRTGLASALILYSLGADRKTILEDYLYSTENLRPYWEPCLDTKPHLIPYYTVKESYLEAAFRTIEKYGGIDNYLLNEIGADPARLRELYTE